MGKSLVSASFALAAISRIQAAFLVHEEKKKGLRVPVELRGV